MTKVKRIEIIANCVDTRTIIREIERIEIKGYSIISGLSGRGKHGKSEESRIDAMANCYIMTACSEEQANALIITVTPLLKRLGGFCLVSDALKVDLE